MTVKKKRKGQWRPFAVLNSLWIGAFACTLEAMHHWRGLKVAGRCLACVSCVLHFQAFQRIIVLSCHSASWTQKFLKCSFCWCPKLSCTWKENDVFYFNFETGESVGISMCNMQESECRSCFSSTDRQVWDHPCDEFHRLLYKREKARKLGPQISNDQQIWSDLVSLILTV